MNAKDGFDCLVEDVKSLPEEERLNVFWRSAREAGVSFQNADLEYLKRASEVLSRNVSAESTYLPKASEDRVVIFSAEQNSRPLAMDDQPTLMKMVDEAGLDNPMAENPTLLGWDRYCSNIETHTVPGSHFSMLHPPHVRTLAEKLKHYLD